MASALHRRWWFVLVGLVVVASTAVLVWGLTRPSPRIDWDHYTQIKEGMTLAEVEAIIRTPPGNFGGHDPNTYWTRACRGWCCSLFIDRHMTPTITVEKIQENLDSGRIVLWLGPTDAIAVQLDGDERVVGCGFATRLSDPTWWQSFLNLFGS
jgi:hypothetical protein